MSARAAAALCVALAGCSTVTAMQTASVVTPGRLRSGAQLSAALFCADFGANITSCAEYPDGVPLPELRVNGRTGLTRGFDVGASVQAQAQVLSPERPFQLGATVDVKGELMRVHTAGPTHIVSLALLGGAATAGRLTLPLWGQFEWGLPLFYGLQFERLEVVFGATLSQRLNLAHGVTPATDSARVGLSVGVFTRVPTGLAAQVGFVADPSRFSAGALQVQVAYFFDVRLPRLSRR